MADDDLWDPRTLRLTAAERARLRRTGWFLALMFVVPLSLEPTLFTWEVFAMGDFGVGPGAIASLTFVVHLLVLPSLLGLAAALVLVRRTRRRAGIWILGTWMVSSLVVLGVHVLAWLWGSPRHADFEVIAGSFLIIVGLLCGPLLQGAAHVVRDDGWSRTAGRMAGWSAVLLGFAMLLDVRPGARSLRLVELIGMAFERGDGGWLVGIWLSGVLLYILLGMTMFMARAAVPVVWVLIVLGRILFAVGIGILAFASFAMVASLGGEVGWVWILSMARTLVVGALIFALVGQGLRLWIGRGGPGGRLEARHVEAF